MKGYTVTVTPDDATEATATIHYELSGGAPRLTDVHFRAGHGQSLSAARMPDIDIAQLLTAVVPAVAVTPAPAALPAKRAAADADVAAPGVGGPTALASLARNAGPADVPVTAAAPRQRRVTASKPAPTTRSKRPGSATAAAAPSKKAPSKRAPSKTSATKKAEPTRAESTRAASAAPAKTAAPATAATKAAAKSTGPATTSGKASLGAAVEATGRVRRLMPDDFADMYRQAPTVAAVADYYQVPTYTAQGWVQTARKRGLIPPARGRR
ncbi:MAG TPA: hypothetical protein VGF84_14095 [Micromonosporaceae bacterium]|jgi:hypothetical protein